MNTRGVTELLFSSLPSKPHLDFLNTHSLSLSLNTICFWKKTAPSRGFSSTLSMGLVLVWNGSTDFFAPSMPPPPG